METSCQVDEAGATSAVPETDEPENGHNKARPVRILLVEDQEVVRLGLKLTVQNVPDLEIVGEAADGPSAVARALELCPDVVLMDLGLSGFNGTIASRKIKEQLECKILVLTSHSEPQFILPALEAGVEGYCLKDASRDTLIEAIRTVARGESWLDETVIRKLLGSVKNVDQETTSGGSKVLSNTERNFLLLVLEGKDPREAAEELGVQAEQAIAYTHKV